MHVSSSVTLLLSLTTLTLAQLKSIPEPCASDSECASGCCAFGPNLAGTCSGSVIALETKGGCGFGDSSPNANAAAASGFSQQAAAFSATLGAGSGSTAATASAAAGNAGAVAATPAPTTLATVLISAGVNEGTVVSTAATASAEAAAPVASAAPGSGSGSTSSTSTSTSSNCQVGTGNAVPGNAAGGSFITGCCDSDVDCASTCCDFTTGTCAAADVAKGNGHGCNFGGASPVFKNSVKRRNRVVPMY